MSEPLDAQARVSIKTITSDPVTRLLLDHSQLTLTQLETLLADSVSSEADEKKGRRRMYRPSKQRISRGAFNRTLIQAENNVIRSIYTVLLLGYSGLFDNVSLQPFLELSDTIQSYIQETRETTPENRSALEQLNQKLLDGISSLAKRQSFKDTL